jgi:hypothetical protein
VRTDGGANYIVIFENSNRLVASARFRLRLQGLSGGGYVGGGGVGGIDKQLRPDIAAMPGVLSVLVMS